MRYLKTYKVFESVSNIKSDLEDIFLEVKDRAGEGWFYWVEGDDISQLVEVYISFGGEEPYNDDFEDDDETYISDYPEVQISQDLIDSMMRSIEYMNSNGYSCKILLCSEYSSDPSEDVIEEITMDDLEPGQWMQENQAIRLKFKKSKLNEELKPSVYSSAATKLQQLGHKRRAAELQSWSTEQQEKQKRAEELLRKTDISQFPPFKLQFYSNKWDSKQNRNLQNLIVEGLFYLEPQFSSSWLGDMMWDHESDQQGLCAYIEFGTTPADEETQQKWNESIKGTSIEYNGLEHQGICFTTRIAIPIFEANSFQISPTGKCYWEAIESEEFVFADRVEAIKFKKFLIEALEGKNQWGKNKWYPTGLAGQFKKFFEDDLAWREKERSAGKDRREQYFKLEDMPIFINRIKTGLSINDLYRN